MKRFVIYVHLLIYWNNWLKLERLTNVGIDFLVAESSTNPVDDYSSVDHFDLYHIKPHERIDSVLSANVELFAGSDKYNLHIIVRFYYGSGDSWFGRPLYWTANFMRFDYRIFIMVYITAEFTKVGTYLRVHFEPDPTPNFS